MRGNLQSPCNKYYFQTLTREGPSKMYSQSLLLWSMLLSWGVGGALGKWGPRRFGPSHLNPGA